MADRFFLQETFHAQRKGRSASQQLRGAVMFASYSAGAADHKGYVGKSSPIRRNESSPGTTANNSRLTCHC